MRRNPSSDVAIYSPSAAVVYEQWANPGTPRGEDRSVPGGAAVQAALLARALSALGTRVAHVVYPLELPSAEGANGVKLVERRQPRRAGPIKSALAELRAVWDSLKAADASAYVFRGSSGKLAVGALFCLVHRRRLIFSAANDLDFEFDRPDRSRTHLAILRWSLRHADAAVLQTGHQARLAADAGCAFPRAAVIPSFAQVVQAPARKPEAFLWIGRVVDYKRPLPYIRLAEALPDLTFWMVLMETTETEPSMAREVHEAARALPNLELIPPQPRDGILDLMTRAHAIVSTSLFEGMPNVFLEAWARGIPVLSLDFDPDGKIETRSLGVAAEGRWDDFVGGAVKINEATEESRIALAQRTRRYIEETHSPEAVARTWREVLDRRPIEAVSEPEEPAALG